MRLVLAALACTVAVGCSQTATEDDKGDTAALIVGGTTAAIETWPGMAQLETAQGVQCGATLISPEWVVTAAHCFETGKTNGGWTRVAFGRQNSNAGGGEVIAVKEAFMHQQYNETTMQNDIALVHLAQKTTRQPAKVMTAAEWTTLGKGGTQVTVVGWGAAQEGGAMVTGLRQVTIPLIDSAQCAGMSLAGATLGPKMICAGLPTGGKDACQGDSGGPLFMQVGGKPVQVGIVSFGEGCARAGAPGVYTQIAGYIDWINTSTNNALTTTPTTPSPTPPTTPESTETPGSEETGTSTVPTSGDTGDVDTDTGDVADEDDETSSSNDDGKTTSKPKAKKKKKKTLAQPAACAMTAPGTTTTNAAALAGLALAATVLLRRRSRRS